VCGRRGFALHNIKGRGEVLVGGQAGGSIKEGRGIGGQVGVWGGVGGGSASMV
jgi:hypothetical protein